jgi:elongation factor P--beta-lysine ligase
MTDIEKYEKYLEGLTLNDYFSENVEMLTELRRIITECKRRRKVLLSEGKPIINYDFPRMI